MFATVGFWLASAGTFSSTISPTPGIQNGLVATVTTMDATATGAGAGNSISGIAIERIRIAKAYTSAVNVSVAWLDPQDANSVLNNPNAQLQFTLYHPVATADSNGNCGISNSIKIKDGSTTYCALADSSATGSSTVSSGSLFLSASLLTGYLLPSVDGSGTDGGCTTTQATWCKISNDGSSTSDGTSQRTMWLVATIDVPGNAPKGQQAQAGSLQFNVIARTRS